MQIFWGMCAIVAVGMIAGLEYNRNERADAKRTAAANAATYAQDLEGPVGYKRTYLSEPPEPPEPPFATTPKLLNGDAIPPELPRVGSSSTPTLGLFITVGTTRAQVEAVQGTPNKVDKDFGETWWYESSRVEFSNGKVKGWHQASGNPLHVGWTASKTARAELAILRGYVVVGSTRDEVVALHGPPSALDRSYGETWRYGASRFEFSSGLVRGWDISSYQALKVRTSAADKFDVAKLRIESVGTPKALAPKNVSGEEHFPQWRRDPRDGHESWDAVFYFHDDKAGYAMLAVMGGYAKRDTYTPISERMLALFLVVEPSLASACGEATLLVGGQTVPTPNMKDKATEGIGDLRPVAVMGIAYDQAGRVANGASVSLVVCGRVFVLRKKDAKALQELARNLLLGVRGVPTPK